MPVLDLTETECRIVLAGLAELPLKISLPVARKVETQLMPKPEVKEEE